MQLRGTDLVLDKVRARQNVISGSGATISISPLNSGSLVLMDRAAGIVFTLPVATAANVGMYFDFKVLTTVTTNAYKVITGAATEFLIGSYMSVDTDTSNVGLTMVGNGSTHIAVNMTAASSNALGGIEGTTLRFTCLSTTRWAVAGVVHCAGTPSTAFATS